MVELHLAVLWEWGLIDDLEEVTVEVNTERVMCCACFSLWHQCLFIIILSSLFTMKHTGRKITKIQTSEGSQSFNKADKHLADQKNVIWPSFWQYAKPLGQLKKIGEEKWGDQHIQHYWFTCVLTCAETLGGNMKCWRQ